MSSISSRAALNDSLLPAPASSKVGAEASTAPTSGSSGSLGDGVPVQPTKTLSHKEAARAKARAALATSAASFAETEKTKLARIFHTE